MTSSFSFIYNKSLDYQTGGYKNRNNPIYHAVEDIFIKLNLDKKNKQSPNWNPLGMLIKKGNNVVVKPNFVTARDKEYQLSDRELMATSTHPSVLLPIIDYIWKAMKGKGKISLVDSPLEGTDLEEVFERLKINKMLNMLKNEGVNIEFIDLRDFLYLREMLFDNSRFGNYSVNIGLLWKKNQQGDPQGYKIIDLAENSYLHNKSWDYRKLRFHRANPTTPRQYHSLNHNLYSISRTVLESDVFINVPKLKTHKKTGVTLCLKSLIGITNRKHWLPHYRSGCPPDGDEYPGNPPPIIKIQQRLSRLPLFFGHSLILNIVNSSRQDKAITEGNWPGNDTLWRVILDLNKILLFADKDGKIRDAPQRKYFCFIDGIWAGEGEGPLRPIPKKMGILTGGFNPAILDAFTTSLIGLNYKKIKHIINSFNLFNVNPKEIDKTDINCDRNIQINHSLTTPQHWESLYLNN